MLNNLRRKRVQRSNVEICDELNNLTSIWWSKDMLVYGAQCTNLGKQRYSKLMSKKSFEYYRPKLNLIPYYKVNDEIYNLILCPSGSFQSGSNNPKAFLLGETEITQELYCAVMNVGNPSKFKDNPKNPVEKVSWYDAVIFCNKLSDMFKLDRYYTITEDGKSIDIIEAHRDYKVETNENSKGFRLPTEWEWEYAAKARTQLLYSGSNNVDDVGWYKDNSGGTTHEIKGKNPNAWGFYDMSGNVWEWCENRYNSTSALRVARGGSWSSYASGLRSARRSLNSPDFRYGDLGFRVCRYI